MIHGKNKQQLKICALFGSKIYQNQRSKQHSLDYRLQSTHIFTGFNDQLHSSPKLLR